MEGERGSQPAEKRRGIKEKSNESIKKDKGRGAQSVSYGGKRGGGGIIEHRSEVGKRRKGACGLTPAVVPEKEILDSGLMKQSRSKSCLRRMGGEKKRGGQSTDRGERIGRS